ncbi:MAG: UDP-N-acetylmuramoyl-L-alanyl-D-glutamate--2,6-diaminopimelate ligase [Clostridia bacterium]|nr:UDP-N-acetylmuramoyl-L-alanyl-D-glutamate--2,6-diaminopimelate ligase [Clostridia bacterium]
MKLTDLLAELSPLTDLPDAEICEITERSTSAAPHSLFVCIPGAVQDGHSYAPDAYARGCRAFLAERPLELPADAAVICVPNTRACLGRLAAKLYGPLSPDLRLIGITGTKGKTTTAQMITHILNRNCIPTGYIGTNGISFGKVRRSTVNTTPDPVTLWKTLREMQAHGIAAVVLEVSSQALMQYRVVGLPFDTVLFTNLFPDHIGPREHQSFDEYKNCKKMLFSDYGARIAIVNIGDPHAKEMLACTSAEKILRCGVNIPAAELVATNVTLGRQGALPCIRFDLSSNASTTIPCVLPLTGKVNACNAVLAIACAQYCFSIPLKVAAESLSDVSVEGRSQVIPLPNGACVIIDYAHNGESLRQLLSTFREYRPHRLLCLFGSIGERAKLRRRELGQAAAELSDVCILTSDNPGKESPEAILDEISSAVEEYDTPYLRITDRTEAVLTALRLLQPGDILLLAGKGHENYQLIGTEKIPFSEKELIQQYTKQSLLPS